MNEMLYARPDMMGVGNVGEARRDERDCVGHELWSVTVQYYRGCADYVHTCSKFQ